MPRQLQCLVRPRLCMAAPGRPTGSALFADNGRCRPWRRNRIRVPMYELPSTLLQSKHAGHAYSYLDEFLAAADLSLPALHLDYAREVVGYIIRYEFYTSDLSIAVVRGGAGQGCFNLLPAACVRAERVAQSHVFRIGVQCLVTTGVASGSRLEPRGSVRSRCRGHSLSFDRHSPSKDVSGRTLVGWTAARQAFWSADLGRTGFANNGI